jgi:hypothetical protein
MAAFVIVRHEKFEQTEFVGVQSTRAALDGFLGVFPGHAELKLVERWSSLPGLLTEGAERIFRVFAEGRSTPYYALELR